MTSPTNRERLGRALLARRHELGLTQEDVEHVGGPTPPTVSDYEKGRIPSKPWHRTLSGFDAALEWEPGSCAAVLNGGDPTPVAKGHDPGKGRRALVDLDEVSAIAIAARRAARLAEEANGLSEALLQEIRDLRTSSATLMVSAISSREPDEGNQ